MKRAHAIERGRSIAALLAGAWRSGQAPGSQLPHAFEEILPLLMASGTAALAWHRIRHSVLSETALASELRQAYRLHALQAAVHDGELASLVEHLRQAGHDPILGKGWAIARLYPEAGLRPYGDFDLFTRADAHGAIEATLRAGTLRASVDLHRGAAELDDRGFDVLVARSQVVDAGGLGVRIFGPEDHLRLLCLHLLRHGAWRPLWLLDVAVALESRPSGFDWVYFLSGDRARTDGVGCAIGLAHQLLGADVRSTPVEARAGALPRWLVPAVLEQWGRGQVPHGRRRPMAAYLKAPTGIVAALRVRWPNAIEATAGVGATYNNLPRLPYQVAECVRRIAGFTRGLRGEP